MTSLDQTLFLSLNAATEPAGPLLWLALLCAKHLYLLVPLHMALAWIGGDGRVREVAIVGLFALLAALLVSGSIGLLVYTPRPSIAGIGHAWIEHRPSAAFPSNHAIVCFTWAATLALFGRLPLAAAVAVLGLLVAWSRIFLGIHYPVDMVGAALVGSGAAMLSAWLLGGYGYPALALAEEVRRRISRLGAGGRAGRA